MRKTASGTAHADAASKADWRGAVAGNARLVVLLTSILL